MECLVLSWEVRRIASHRKVDSDSKDFGITSGPESLRGCPRKQDIVTASVDDRLRGNRWR